MNTLISYKNYNYDLAKEVNEGKKRAVIDKYVLEEDYKTESDEPFLISSDDGHYAVSIKMGQRQTICFLMFFGASVALGNIGRISPAIWRGYTSLCAKGLMSSRTILFTASTPLIARMS